jgi:hypothetical protein
MGNENTARIKENSAIASRENESLVAENTYRCANRSQTTVFQKSGIAGGSCTKIQLDPKDMT